MTELYTITVVTSLFLVIVFTLAGYALGWSVKRFIGAVIIILMGGGFSLWMFNNYVEHIILQDTTLLRYKMGIEGSSENANFARAFYEKSTDEQKKILYDIEHNINMDRAEFGYKHRMGFSDVSPDYLGSFIDVQRQLYLLPLIVPLLLIGAGGIGRWVQMEGAYGELRAVREEVNKKKEENQDFDKQIDTKRQEIEKLQQRLDKLLNDVASKSDIEAELAKLHQSLKDVKERVTKEMVKENKLTATRNKSELDIRALQNEAKKYSDELKKKKDELEILCKAVDRKQLELEKKQLEIEEFDKKEKVSADIMNEFLE